MSTITREDAIRAAETILRESGIGLQDLYVDRHSTWSIDEEEAEALSQFIGDSEPAPITLSVGPATLDDGSETYGLKCWNSEYPEEGYILLRETEKPKFHQMDEMQSRINDLEARSKTLAAALEVARNVLDPSALTYAEMDTYVAGAELLPPLEGVEEVDPLDRFPKPFDGWKRTWVACKTCGNVAHRDFIPYAIANPILTLPCGHQGGQRFHDAVVEITDDEAREFFRKQDKDQPIRI